MIGEIGETLHRRSVLGFKFSEFGFSPFQVLRFVGWTFCRLTKTHIFVNRLGKQWGLALIFSRQTFTSICRRCPDFMDLVGKSARKPSIWRK
jgi:hypothetical protein